MSALITSTHRLSDFNVSPLSSASGQFEGVQDLATIGEMQHVARDVPAIQTFDESEQPRGLALKSLTLHGDFRSFIERLFDSKSNVYYLAWCWDLSGQPINVFPGKTSSAEDVMFGLRPGESQRFMGAGSLLFPQRVISGGLVVRLQVWQSDAEVRRFGETLASVCNEIRSSKLNSLLTLIGTLAGVATAQVVLIEQAALELGAVIGTILKANGDDFVDLYEGYFPVSEQWAAGEFAETNRFTKITFTRIGGKARMPVSEYQDRIAEPVEAQWTATGFGSA